jgi:transposase
MFESVFPHLDERQRRLAAGAAARALGHGGMTAVVKASGLSQATVSDGVWELEAGSAPLGRVRRPGGGRKPVTETDPGLVPALMALVEPERRGDPVSPLRWTTASLRDLARELTDAGHPISAPVVGKLLHQLGFSLQGMAKTRAGSQVPDRDAQFRHIVRHEGTRCEWTHRLEDR